jgi:DNA-binding SARP family transcriptional activator
MIRHAPSTGRIALRLRLIGPMAAWTPGGDDVLPNGRKTRALLALIALSPARSISRNWLAQMLWSHRPEEQARASLRQELHVLLDTLAPAGAEILDVMRDQVSLKSSSLWVDVNEVLRATPSEPISLSLCDGELLEDLDALDPAFDAWLRTERQRLRSQVLDVTEALMEEATDPATILWRAEQVRQIDPAHEGAWRATIRAHLGRGDRDQARAAFERCKKALAQTPGISPSTRTLLLMPEWHGADSREAASPGRQRSAIEPRLKPRERTRDDADRRRPADSLFWPEGAGPRVRTSAYQRDQCCAFRSHMDVGSANDLP